MADMYLVTCEDDDGMWFDDPVAGFSAGEARALARKKWPVLHHSKALILYRCSQMEEVETIQTIRDASATADSRGAASPQSSESTDSPTTGEAS